MPAVPEPEALAVLDGAIAGVGADVIVHCCGSKVPWDLLRRSGARAIAFDVAMVDDSDFDGVGELVESGKELIVGAVPTTASPRLVWRDCAKPVEDLFSQLGFPHSYLRERVAVSPSCGLAGTSEKWARQALRLAADVRSSFEDE